MFQLIELNSIVSGSKLWDWETVSMPAAYLQTLCTNAMPCFGVTVPIICWVFSFSVPPQQTWLHYRCHYDMLSNLYY